MASTYLKRVTTSTGSNYTATFSGWVKRATTGVRHVIWAGWESSTERMVCGFESSDRLQMQIYTGGTAHDIETTRLFRDTSAWYHIVFQFNTSSGTEADRFKIFVNGVQETSFAVDDTIGQNIEMKMWGSTSQETIVGCRKNSGYEHFYDGCMSHVHIIDGTVYAPTEFGETDATTGEWKIKTSPSVSYGTNGYFILKDGNSGTDESPNSNNFTTVGTITKTEDNPSHVFATFNPLLSMNSSMSLANGNTKATTGNGYDAGRSNSYFSTLGMTKGKYYAEFKVVTAPSTACLIGVGYDLSSAQQGTTTNQYNLSFTNLGFSYNSVGSIGNDGDGWTSTGYDTYTADDYIGIAIDCDNWKLYVSKNGTWQNSGTGFSITADKEYFFAVSDNNGAQVYVYEANFGNGCFGSTQLTGTTYNGADGNGIFKYDPNNITLDSTTKSFKSLSTKGLNA